MDHQSQRDQDQRSVGYNLQQALARADIAAVLLLLSQPCVPADFNGITLSADERLHVRVLHAAWHDASRDKQQDQKAHAVLPAADRKEIQKNLTAFCEVVDPQPRKESNFLHLDELQLIKTLQQEISSGETLTPAEKIRVTKELVRALDERACEAIRMHVSAARRYRVALGEVTSIGFGIGNAASTAVSTFIVATALFGSLPLAFTLAFFIIFPAACWANWTVLNSILPRRMRHGLGFLQFIEPTTGEVQSLTGWDKAKAVLALTLTAIMATAFFAITAYSLLSIPIKFAAALGMTIMSHGVAANTLTLLLLLATNPWGWLALAGVALFAAVVGYGYFVIFAELMVKNSRQQLPRLAQLWERLRTGTQDHDWKRAMVLGLVLCLVAFGVIMTSLFASYALLGIFGTALVVKAASWILLVVTSAVLLPSYWGAAHAAIQRHWPTQAVAQTAAPDPLPEQSSMQRVTKMLLFPIKVFLSLLLIDRFIVRPSVKLYDYVKGRAWPQAAPRVTATLQETYGLQAEQVLRRGEQDTFTLFDQRHAKQFTQVQRTAQFTNASANGALPTPDAMRLVSAVTTSGSALDPVTQVLAGIGLTVGPISLGIATAVGSTCASAAFIATAEPAQEEPVAQTARLCAVGETLAETQVVQSDARVTPAQHYKIASSAACSFWRSAAKALDPTPVAIVNVEKQPCVVP